VVVRINRPDVWHERRDGQKVLVEPLLCNFQKFNSNTGYTRGSRDDITDLMQALSHFSYHYTSGEYLLCDLQGSRDRTHCTLTDPVVFSATREFGLTDLGNDGMKNFFYYHRCNRFCRRCWIEAMPEHIYIAEEGTAFANWARRVQRADVSQLTQEEQLLNRRIMSLACSIGIIWIYVIIMTATYPRY